MLTMQMLYVLFHTIPARSIWHVQWMATSFWRYRQSRNVWGLSQYHQVGCVDESKHAAICLTLRRQMSVRLTSCQLAVSCAADVSDMCHNNSSSPADFSAAVLFITETHPIKSVTVTPGQRAESLQLVNTGVSKVCHVNIRSAAGALRSCYNNIMSVDLFFFFFFF